MKAIDTLKMYAEATKPTTEDQVGRGFGLIAGDKLDEIISELEELEALCKDMYYDATNLIDGFEVKFVDLRTAGDYKHRMHELGLLEED